MEDEDHNTEDVQLPAPAGLVEEDSSDSSCMVVLKLPSLENDAPASDERTVSPRTPRRRNSKQVVYDDSQTSKSGRKKRERFDSEAHTLAMEKAKELQASLPTEEPSFIKQMQTSHVVYKFVMGVPLEFRKSHLPTLDAEVVLEDESGEIYKMKYISGIEGKFVNGWKKFSRANNLREGDIVVFHLLKSCYFKVYIIRASDANIVGSTNVTNEGTKRIKCEAADTEGPGLAPEPDTVQESGKGTSSPSIPCVEPGSDHSRSEQFKSADAEASESSGCEADAENTTNVAEDDKCGKSRRRTRGREHSEADTLAWNRAEELQSNLSSEYPSFIKQMLRSNVYPKPVLLIPVEFCNSHMPKHDTDVTFEDESGELYAIKFLVSGRGKFLGGLKNFVAKKKVVEGDVAVFHLIKPCYFKVYMIRINDSAAVISANPTSSDVNANDEGKILRICDSADRDKDLQLAPPQPDTVQESAKKSSLVSNPGPSNPSPDPGSVHSSTKDVLSSEAGPAVSSLSGRCADFENFKIIVHGKAVDAELPRSTRFKYYKLCCSQGTYLHAGFLETVDPPLAAGLITNMLKVADSIRSCKLSTSKEEFATLEKTLGAFQKLGLNVDFLFDRLKRLASFAARFREKEEVKKYIAAKRERNRIREQMKPMEKKLLELKQAAEGIGEEMKTMKARIKRCKETFQNEASAPW